MAGAGGPMRTLVAILALAASTALAQPSAEETLSRSWA